MRTSTWITIIGVAVLVLIIGLVAGFVKIKTKEKPEDLSAQVEDLAAEVESKGEKLYSHHFDVSIGHDTAAWIPTGNRLDLNFNVISNDKNAFQTLSQIDGAGYIASAFGAFHNTSDNQIDYTNIVQAKLFYSSVNNGSLLVTLYGISSYSTVPFIITNLNDYALQDSVSPIN